jgi:cytidine deaminase
MRAKRKHPATPPGRKRAASTDARSRRPASQSTKRTAARRRLPRKQAPTAMITLAREARERARAPYSRFKVGAALKTRTGEIVTGCNIENASYGLSVCAERVAVWKAVSEGLTGFEAIAIVSAAEQPTPPCGACRQILWEYCGDIAVHMANLTGRSRNQRLRELLPLPFDASRL